jgi:hypothetical protein
MEDVVNYNPCPSCSNEAAQTGKKHFESDEWKCGACGIEFYESGLGTKLVPVEFKEGETYFGIVFFGPEQKRVEFTVLKKDLSSVHAHVDGKIMGVFELSVFEEVEVIKVEKNLIGKSFIVLPYNLVLSEE